MGRLDDYDVFRVIGEGGMAVVYLGRTRKADQGEHRFVALKELHPELASDPTAAKAFVDAATVWASLGGTGVARVHEVFVEEDTPFVVMELVAGDALRAMLGRPQTLAKSAAVLEGVLQAVALAGRQGSSHGDLKPENVLFTAEGELKVGDFGIGAIRRPVPPRVPVPEPEPEPEPQPVPAVTAADDITVTGAAESDEAEATDADADTPPLRPGTPAEWGLLSSTAYASPEQLRARTTPGHRPPLTVASDLYAVGCLAFELLTGNLPHPGETPEAIAAARLEHPVPDLHVLREQGVPPPVEQWVATMCDPDPSERPASADDAWAALESAIREFVGATWRRRVRLAPDEALEIPLLPPPGDTPLRGCTLAGGRIPATRGYVYQPIPVNAAPIEEQLEPEVEEEEPEEPAEEAPEAPASIDDLPPAPDVSVTLDEGTEEVAPRPVLAACAAGLVALVAGVLLATSGDVVLASADGNGLTLRAPTDWVPVAPRGVRGLGPGAVALAPPASAPGTFVAAGRVRRVRPDLLPVALDDRRRIGSGSRVGLAAGTAVLHRRVRAGAVRGDLYTLPTEKDGTIVVLCVGVPAERCAEVAGSVEVDGSVADLGPTEDGADALQAASKRLREAIVDPTTRLRRATSRSGQAYAARAFARVFREAAADFADSPVGVLADRPLAELVRGLRRSSQAWNAYGRAADQGRTAATDAARARIARGRRAIRKARADLGRVGYGGRRG